MTKYRAVKTTLDGITFDSKREAARYAELKMMQAQGVIDRLELQPVYQITINGRKVCKVIPDFRYFCNARQRHVVEDVKSPATEKNATFRLKKRLLEAAYFPVKLEVIK